VSASRGLKTGHVPLAPIEFDKQLPGIQSIALANNLVRYVDEDECGARLLPKSTVFLETLHFFEPEPVKMGHPKQAWMYATLSSSEIKKAGGESS